jgi:predicted secreted protein
MDGIKVADLLSLVIKRDGTATINAMDKESSGTWKEIDGGIRVESDQVTTDMLLVDGQLKAEAEEAIIYFNRTGQAVGVTATPTEAPKNEFSFAGAWKAVRYETMGYTFDANVLFPEGCTITLNEDGTGKAVVTSAYTEKITWQENGGALFINGSYVFSTPVYNVEKSELTMFYGSDTVSVIFHKNVGESPAPTQTPHMTVIPLPTEEVTRVPAEPPTPEPVLDSELCKTSMFTAVFPGKRWVNNDGWRSDSESYCAVKYELKDQSGSVTASVTITASSEGVDTYRGKIKALSGYAKKTGNGSLDEVAIGGITFSGTGYEDWGLNYTEYAARIPESGITLMITLEQPENMGDDLQPILDSIAYHLPVLTPPNADPPMPEDGTPYQPVPAAVTVGDREISATWLKTGEPIVLDSMFYNQAALSAGRLYVLAGNKLYAYTLKDDTLTPDPVFGNGFLELDEAYECLCAGKDGILYVSEGVFSILAIRDGIILQDNGISGNLSMHPDGDWGISYWANAEPKLVRASDGVLTEEPWVLSNLSDAGNRKGRFSSISCVSIAEKRIYVAGTDAEKGDAQRVAVYDLKGKELFTFGSEDWTRDDAFGSVTGIVETKNGILVQDRNNRAFKLFSNKGVFIGSVASDALLGTDYPWLSSMIGAEDGVLIAAAQERKDQSCDELLLYLIKGF